MAARSTLRRAVSDALVARGYEREDQLLRRPIDDEFTWVVDTGPLDRGPDISPYIGLRHERAHKVFSECIELYDSGFVATGGSNLGYVLGHGFRTWHEPTTPEALIAEIEKGQEVLAQFLSLARMPDIYDIRGAKGPGYHFKLAAIYFVLDDYARVRDWLAEGERTDCRVPGGVCEQFRRFERNLEARMTTS